MQRDLFNSWLRERAFNNPRVVSDNKSRCARVERDLNVDLDEEFTRDRLEHLLGLLTYSREDEINNVPPPGNIQMASPRAGMNNLKNAVINYRSFRQAGTLNLPNTDTTSFSALKEAFGIWMEEDYSRNTIASYKSSLGSLRDAVNVEKGEGWFDGIAEAFRSHNDEHVRHLCLECQNFIFAKKREDRAHESAWADKASAYNQFVDFLSDRYDIDEFIEQQPIVQPPINQHQNTAVQAARTERYNEEAFELNRSQLKIKFLNSLKTQSRYYPNNGIQLLVPSRLINTIFSISQDRRFYNWLIDGINSMVFLGDNRQSTFETIQSLVFDGHGEVTAHTDQDSFVLFTRALNDERQEYLRPVNVVYPKQLSIDHVTALENIVRQNQNGLPALRKITNHFNELNALQNNTLNPRQDREWKDSLIAQHREEYMSQGFRDLIMNDLESLHVEYELMETRENSRMGNR